MQLLTAKAMKPRSLSDMVLARDCDAPTTSVLVDMLCSWLSDGWKGDQVRQGPQNMHDIIYIEKNVSFFWVEKVEPGFDIWYHHIFLVA